MVSGATHPSRAEADWMPRYNALTICVVADEKGQRRMRIQIYPRVWQDSSDQFEADSKNCDDGCEYKTIEFKLDPCEKSHIDAHEFETGQGIVDLSESTLEKESASTMNIRQLTYEFLNLPYSEQMKIATEMELLDDGDHKLEKAKLFKKILRRAKQKHLLLKLQQNISKRTENN
jgi:hypothetical protein